MFNLDPGKLLVIAVVAIILLGPDRLPQVARQVGGAWRSFNEFRHRMESEVRNYHARSAPDLRDRPAGPFAVGPAQPPLDHVLRRGTRRARSSRRAATEMPRRTRSTAPVRRPTPDSPAAAGTRTPIRADGPPPTRRAPSEVDRPRRPQPQLSGPPVVTLPFTAKRKSRPSPDNMTLGSTWASSGAG